MERIQQVYLLTVAIEPLSTFLKLPLAKVLNWDKSITKPNPNNMNVIPVSFAAEHKQMLSHFAMMVSKEYLAIPKEYDKLAICT